MVGSHTTVLLLHGGSQKIIHSGHVQVLKSDSEICDIPCFDFYYQLRQISWLSKNTKDLQKNTVQLQ